MSDSEMLLGLLPSHDGSDHEQGLSTENPDLIYNMDVDVLSDQELEDKDILVPPEMADADGDDAFLAPNSPASNKPDSLLGLGLEDDMETGEQQDNNLDIDLGVDVDAGDALNDSVLDNDRSADDEQKEVPLPENSSEPTESNKTDSNAEVAVDIQDLQNSVDPNGASSEPKAAEAKEKEPIKKEETEAQQQEQPKPEEGKPESELHTDDEQSDNELKSTDSKDSQSLSYASLSSKPVESSHSTKRRILTSSEPEEEPEPEPEKPFKNEPDDELSINIDTEVPQIEPARIPEPSNIDTNDKTRVRQTHAIVIPSYASWFNMKKIHQIERDSLPEFFKTSHPSKSPKIYANYRNFMINAYRLNPNEYLTLTACRRTLVGDVSTLMRVHRFLNKWGLINYQVNPLFKPSYALEKLPNGSLVGLPNCGDFNVQFDTPRGLFPFNTYKPSPGNVNLDKLKQLIGSNSTATANGSLAPGKENSEGEPPLKKQKIESGDWSSKELAALLLGIKNHKHDWFQIAKTVGNNRSPQECILKFLNMPIEDKYTELSDKDLGILKFAPNFPVLSADNPVISNLIFITNFVDADVVKAASAKACKVMDSKILDKIEEVYGEKTDSDSQKQNGAKKSPTEINGNVGSEDLNDILKSEFNEDERESIDVINEAATATLGAVAARSHLFATYEEREMQKITQTIVNQELNKVEVKLNKVKVLEKVFEKERHNLEKQQNEIFLDRLALTKSTISISQKLQKAVEILKTSHESDKSESAGESVESISTLLKDINELLARPVSHSLTESQQHKTSDKTHLDNNPVTRDLENTHKPLSVVAPQNFKVWVP